MIYFKNDYSTGGHPLVMDALMETNMINTVGYGMDEYTADAKQTIKNRIKCQNCDIYFTMAGTQTNLTCLAAFLRPHQAVISADTGHICVHEVAAIEATGHKVIHVPTVDGKLRPEDLDAVMIEHDDPHYVRPKAIYVSDLTETGLIYKKAELQALREACDKHNLYLYLDGARLAMALTQPENDLTFEDLPKLCDAFYIGGTKCGILFGEAIVIVNDDLKPDFTYLMKQRGAILAKGRLLGVQFKAIMENDLYLSLGEDANRLAWKLIDGIKKAGYEFDCEPCSNMVFPIFPNELIEKLSKEVEFEFWKKFDNGMTAIRLCTSWSTTEQEVDEFLSLI